MQESDVTIKPTQFGGLEIFVSDEATDTLAIIKVSKHKHGPTFSLTTTLRGNYDAKDRRAQHASLVIDAPEVSPEELDRRRVAAGLPSKRPKDDLVSVVFKTGFSSPSEAAQSACKYPTFVRAADAALKLTIGDEVVINGNGPSGFVEATVVALMADRGLRHEQRVVRRAS